MEFFKAKQNFIALNDEGVAGTGVCIVSFLSDVSLRKNLSIGFFPKEVNTRVVPKVMSTFFWHANWEQQTKESAMVDGTSSCVILECLVTSIACIT